MAITFSGRWADIDADLISILAEADQEFTLNGNTYPCVINRPARGGELMEGGEWQTYAGKVTTRRAIIDTIPAEGDSVTIDDETFTVGLVTASDSNPVLEFQIHNTAAPR